MLFTLEIILFYVKFIRLKQITIYVLRNICFVLKKWISARQNFFKIFLMKMGTVHVFKELDTDKFFYPCLIP